MDVGSRGSRLEIQEICYFWHSANALHGTRAFSALSQPALAAAMLHLGEARRARSIAKAAKAPHRFDADWQEPDPEVS